MRSTIIVFVAALTAGGAHAGDVKFTYNATTKCVENEGQTFLCDRNQDVLACAIFSESAACKAAYVADRSWHLLTQSYGGTVSLLHDLTRRECKLAQVKLLDETRSNPGDIRSAECFQ